MNVWIVRWNEKVACVGKCPLVVRGWTVFTIQVALLSILLIQLHVVCHIFEVLFRILDFFQYLRCSSQHASVRCHISFLSVCS